jgi:hypothetical protein
MRMDAERVIEIAKSAGFPLYRCIELPPYHYGVVLGRRNA